MSFALAVSCSPRSSCRCSRSPATSGSSGGRRGTAIAFPNLAVLAVGRRPLELEASPRRRARCSARSRSLCVAVARPTVPLAATADRATVVLVVDVSVSMNRDGRGAEPARGRARGDHVVRRPRARGASRSASSRSPTTPVVVTRRRPTDERSKQGSRRSTPGFGTAIGDAVARGVELVRASTGETGDGGVVDGAPPDAKAAARRGRPALRRRPDARRAEPGRGRAARAAGRDPGLHDRARNARRAR